MSEEIDALLGKVGSTGPRLKRPRRLWLNVTENRWLSAYIELMHERDAAYVTLRKYGQHLPDCNRQTRKSLTIPIPCTCGFSDAQIATRCLSQDAS
jgi:hypothetical protein